MLPSIRDVGLDGAGGARRSAKWGVQRYVLLCVALLFLALVFRNAGLYPVVVDETLYSRFARLIPLADAPVPGYAYLLLYRLTNVCGDEFLGCARVLNSAAFTAAAPLIYLTARRTCGRAASVAIACLALLGPVNVYTAYFMPESMYFLCFWLLTWYALKIDRYSTLQSYGALGLVLGLCMLVKPHAIFLVPALVLFTMIGSPQREGSRRPIALKGLSAFLLCAIALKFGVGYLVAGRPGLSLMGTTYGSMADSGLAGMSHYFELAATAWQVARGHLIALALMFGMPVAATLCIAAASFAERGEGSGSRTALYSILVLTSLFCVVAVFTAAVPYADPNQAVNRLHMRYYNFALPLLWIVAAAQFKNVERSVPGKWRLCAAFPVVLVAAYGVATRLADYDSSYVDSPELRGFMLHDIYFYPLSAVSILALAAWVINERFGTRLYLLVFAPAFVLFASIAVNVDLLQRKTPDVYDRAGLVARTYLAQEDIAKLVIVGSDAAGLMRATMLLDSPSLATVEVPPGSRIDSSDLPADRAWVMTIGDVSLKDRPPFEVSMEDFTLSRVIESMLLSFDRSTWPGAVKSVRGLSQPEAWGTWSSGDYVTFAFKRPLPKRFAVALTGRAYASAPHDAFVMRVGTESKSFSLKEGVLEEQLLEFDNPAGSNLITIEIPRPVSPRERNGVEDDRRLGIAFHGLRIEPR